MMDGWGWRCLSAGLERRNRGGRIEDVDVQDLAQRFVNLPNGWVFMINVDW